MFPLFPQIKIKSKDVDDIQRVRRLKRDLKKLKENILSYAPSNFNYGKLSRLRIRIFKFSRKEDCNEFFVIVGNKKYVCLNASLLNRRYYDSLLYTLHGISHSFCHLKDEIAEEAFCEFVAYSLLKQIINPIGKKFSRRIIRGIMRQSPKEYNTYYRAARKLEKKNKGIMLMLNVKAKNRKISKKKERRIFYRLVKLRKVGKDDSSDEIPELERGFRKI
jgi:hypothetical protein